jgi:hypothetical protein
VPGIFWQIDANGFFLCSWADFDGTEPDTVEVDDPNAFGFLKPKWDGTTVVEGAVAADLDNYKLSCKDDVYLACNNKLIEVHGSVQTMHEHAAKWREANTVKNVVSKGPQALRDEAGQSSTPYIDEYVAEFGGTADAAATAIISAEWIDAQKGAKIARYRIRAFTDIDAATDKAGVDTAVTNLNNNLATI